MSHPRQTTIDLKGSEYPIGRIISVSSLLHSKETNNFSFYVEIEGKSSPIIFSFSTHTSKAKANQKRDEIIEIMRTYWRWRGWRK